ncbi:MAG: hypothetical protein K0R29_1633 [Pseudobdellovibrio sp.]|jgi:hypothetical protein|nr:hypothetical protein [Pseudobdellovibrio sp.]
MSIGKYVFIILLSILTACSSKPVKREKSQLKYTPGQLRFIEVDEMNTMISEQLAIYKKSKDVSVIEELLVTVLSRPDADNILERELLIIQNSFPTFDDWENSVNRVVDRAGQALKDKTCSVQDETSYTIVLENILSEFRAEFNKPDENTDFELSVIERIAAMDLKVSEAAFRDAKINAMSTLVSPSQIAKKLLSEIKTLKR